MPTYIILCHPTTCNGWSDGLVYTTPRMCPTDDVHRNTCCRLCSGGEGNDEGGEADDEGYDEYCHDADIDNDDDDSDAGNDEEREPTSPRRKLRPKDVSTRVEEVNTERLGSAARETVHHGKR